jgi:hypothetical protein
MVLSGFCIAIVKRAEKKNIFVSGTVFYFSASKA